MDYRRIRFFCWSHRSYCRFCRSLIELGKKPMHACNPVLKECLCEDKTLLVYDIWVATWENVLSNMCDRRRHKSSSTSCSPFSVFVVHMMKQYAWLSQIRPVKILIRLRESAGWSESSLGAHVRRHVFCRCCSFRVNVIVTFIHLKPEV